jgi:hypothetical protein
MPELEAGLGSICPQSKEILPTPNIKWVALADSAHVKLGARSWFSFDQATEGPPGAVAAARHPAQVRRFALSRGLRASLSIA